MERARQQGKTLEMRDEIADSLKTQFKSIILEADEWRPLADYILASIRQAEQAEQAARVKALEGAAHFVEEQGEVERFKGDEFSDKFAKLVKEHGPTRYATGMDIEKASLAGLMNTQYQQGYWFRELGTAIRALKET